MRHAHLLVVTVLPIALAAMAPAHAQLFPGGQPFPCHVLHVTNNTHDPVLVNVSIDPDGLVRVGTGMVAACTTGDIPLSSNLRCGVTFNVHGEVKDPTRVPTAMFKLNPAAAPTIARVKGTFTPQNAKEPANWLALVGVPGKEVGWKPIPAGTRMPPGCSLALAPPPPPAPAVVVFIFNNTTASPVLLTAGGPTVIFKNACVGAGQSRSVQVAPSNGYKVFATPVRDAQCQQPISAQLGLGARPVNGRVTIVYGASPYALRQLEMPPPAPTPAPLPVDPSQSAPGTTVPTDPNTPGQGNPTQDPTISVPTGK